MMEGGESKEEDKEEERQLLNHNIDTNVRK
jgi:hypothetical protein